MRSDSPAARFETIPANRSGSHFSNSISPPVFPSLKPSPRTAAVLTLAKSLDGRETHFETIPANRSGSHDDWQLLSITTRL